MSNLSVFGGQWGDEGKGKVVDFFAAGYDVVVRFAGGSNAGHTLVVPGGKLALHLLPSGVARPGTVCVLGDGMIIDGRALLEEIAGVEQAGYTLDASVLMISPRAQLGLPYHRALDEARERAPGGIGTTKRGIGPAYEDKAARRGLRVADLYNDERLRARLEAASDEATARLRVLGGEPPDFAATLAELRRIGERLQPFVRDTSAYLRDAMGDGKRVLFEGAQGVLLDIDQGTYPFVTSSTTLPAGACAGAGVGPRSLGALVAVVKAYVTRVGEGPFPTEIEGEQAERLRTVGAEFGSTTGRPRRCGWLDLPALRYSARVSGMEWIALTKLDVLGGAERIPVCEAYRLGDRTLTELPADPGELSRVQPVLREVEGFGPLAGETELGRLPAGARRYVEMIEQEVGVRVCLVSTGPARDQTIVLHDLR